MKLPEKIGRLTQPPPLTRLRVVLALAIAVATDGMQFLLGWLVWMGADQVMDALAMALTSWAIGFHWLLLPTFALELIPVLDDLPTWTACTLAVIALRKREQRTASSPHPPPK